MINFKSQKLKQLENVLRQAVKKGLPLSISKNLKLQMIGSGGGLRNTNCDCQTTKWEISKPTNYK